MLRNVLLVEDDEAVRMLMGEAFREAGLSLNLDMVNDGEAALSFLRKEREFSNAVDPDLILLDLNMPGRSGLEILKEIKEDKKIDKFSIVVLTGSTAPKDIEACAKFQCPYLLKPSQFIELVNLVKSLQNFVAK